MYPFRSVYDPVDDTVPSTQRMPIGCPNCGGLETYQAHACKAKLCKACHSWVAKCARVDCDCGRSMR